MEGEDGCGHCCGGNNPNHYWNKRPATGLAASASVPSRLDCLDQEQQQQPCQHQACQLTALDALDSPHLHNLLQRRRQPAAHQRQKRFRIFQKENPYGYDPDLPTIPGDPRLVPGGSLAPRLPAVLEIARRGGASSPPLVPPVGSPPNRSPPQLSSAPPLGSPPAASPAVGPPLPPAVPPHERPCAAAGTASLVPAYADEDGADAERPADAEALARKRQRLDPSPAEGEQQQQQQQQQQQ